jgi:hypothetical protein
VATKNGCNTNRLHLEIFVLACIGLSVPASLSLQAAVYDRDGIVRRSDTAVTVVVVVLLHAESYVTASEHLLSVRRISKRSPRFGF